MRILGVGVDIVQNKRIKSSIKKKSFVLKIFGKSEIKLFKKNKNRPNFFAKRFAAKESFSKSIGSGFRNNLNFKDIQILNDPMGKPYYKKSKKISDIITKKFKVRNYELLLSISDEKDYSVAFTILQTK